MTTDKSQERIRTIPSHSDVVVVGSGLGGLLCAIELARQGFKVCVLEQHRVAGGYAHSFRRKGYHFDISLHAIGGLAPGCLTHGVLNSLGIYDKLNIKQCDMLLEADYPDLSISLPNHPGGALEELCAVHQRMSVRMVRTSRVPERHSMRTTTGSWMRAISSTS